MEEEWHGPGPLTAPEARDGRFILRGGDIVTPDGIVWDGSLVIEDGRIAEVREFTPALGGEDVRWVTGCVAPAFVDLHSEALLREIQPRPASTLPPELALLELDRKLAAQGITTVFHAITFGVDEGPRFHPASENVARVVQRRADDLLVRHRVSARCEATDTDAVSTVGRLHDAGHAHLVSVTDEPGGARDELGAAEAMARELADVTKRVGVPLASWEDDCAERIGRAQQLGASIAAFPINGEALVAAGHGGLHVLMGAPSIVRRELTTSGLAALTALELGALDALCSEHYPGSMLHAVFRLATRGHATLHDALRLVSLHPARAVGLDGELGSLEPGKLADVVVIGLRGGWPVVLRTLRAGREVFAADYGA